MNACLELLNGLIKWIDSCVILNENVPPDSIDIKKVQKVKLHSKRMKHDLFCVRLMNLNAGGGYKRDIKCK